ncbi:hypothetical protein ACOME3_008428, partial [Neoechinorhynchus agilis]
ERAKILFDIFDADDNNVVTEKELRKAITGLVELRGNHNMSDADVSRIAARFTSEMDCDGNREISKDEFVYALSTNQNLRKFLEFNYGNA